VGTVAMGDAVVAALDAAA